MSGKPWAKGPNAPKRLSGRPWRRLRAQILERDGYLCQCDQCQGGKLRLRVANEVDHRVPLAAGGTDDPDNLRSVHHECHERITLEQQGHKPRPQVGLDGWPIE